MVILGTETPPNSSSANEGTKACTEIAKGVEAHQAGEYLVSRCPKIWSRSETADTTWLPKGQGAEVGS